MRCDRERSCRRRSVCIVPPPPMQLCDHVAPRRPCCPALRWHSRKRPGSGFSTGGAPCRKDQRTYFRRRRLPTSLHLSWRILPLFGNTTHPEIPKDLKLQRGPPGEPDGPLRPGDISSLLCRLPVNFNPLPRLGFPFFWSILIEPEF